jgi:hypothetical protein
MTWTKLKDPDAVLDYTFDWQGSAPGPWLEAGETITASAWTAPSGITVDSSTFDDTTTTVWLSGGTEWEDYEVVNHVTTSAGREDDRTLTILVRSR